MNFQNKIIGGSYLYIAGIVLAMLFPLDPSWLPWLRVGSALALGAACGLLLLGLLRGESNEPVTQKAVRLLWPALCIGAILLGYTRYTSANTVPDMLIGEIRIEGASRTFHQTVDLPATSRLRLQKTQDIERDIRIRFVGELDARLPEVNEEGGYAMDSQGRWVFRQARIPITSDVVIIAASDPVGTDYVVSQPYTRITGIEWLDGPEQGRVAVHRVSNHIGSFVRPARAQSPVTVLGRITSDPRVYDFKTVLMVTPAYIQYPASGPFYRVEGGDIQVTIHPGMDGYSEFAQTAAYGADVQIQGELTVARAESNPGGFNARQFMQNYNIFGLMRPYQPRGQPAPMRMVAPDGRDVRPGNPLVSFSLNLRDRVLLLFKSTMPYPQSAFLGGVTLGLRYGLQGAQFPGERDAGRLASRIGFGRSEAQIVDDFRTSGVNHVLAVSGLHVTILTVMFVAIFALLKFPKQVFVPFVIFALVVFAIITGARPSTLRAVIMNSLFLLTWAYLDKGLLSSVLIGVPVAAFLILIHNPLVVVDPSFTLSFGAILSLALITMPAHEVLCRLRGNRFMAVIVLVVATTLIGIFHWALITTPLFIAPWLLFGLLLYKIAGALEDQGLGLSRNFAFAGMPEGVSTFIAAQIAIQIGMMVPLSAFYFCRWPFAGAYVNLIAIPLIGVVVQLGAIAGLLGLIPAIGIYFSLLLSAANWIFATFFLWLAHVSTLSFPYPFVRRPRVIEIVVYYLFIGAFIWHKPLWKWIRGVCEKRGWKHRYAPATLACVLALAATSPLWVAPPRDTRPPGLHMTVLSVGYGSAILVESPKGKRILIDTGFVEHERGRRNEAERTILPFFSHSAIRRLDGLILTSPLPERAAGASYILRQMRVGQLILPPMLANLSPEMTEDEFLESVIPLAAGRRHYPYERLESMYHELVGHPVWESRPALATELQGRDDSLFNRWAGWEVTAQTAGTGHVLFEEEGVDGKSFRIEVLGPEVRHMSERYIENNGLVLRVVYGDFAALVPGALHYAGQEQLAERTSENLQAQILIVPHYGAANPADSMRPDRESVLDALNTHTEPLLNRVNPELAIFQFGNPRPVLDDLGRAAINLYETTRQFYTTRLGEEQVLNTDRDLAIMIHSDGHTYSIDTQARRNRSHGGDEGAVSDLSIGL